MRGMPLLPDAREPDGFDRMLAVPELWSAAIEAIRQRHGLDEHFEKTSEGSAVVYLSQRWCIKLHPPIGDFIPGYRRESKALHYLAGRLPIPTPVIAAEGELEGWPYFVATRLGGVPVDRVWAQLDPSSRVRIAEQIGAAARALHDLPVRPFDDLAEPWPIFRAAQRERCLAREREKGLAPALLQALESYLELDALPDPEFGPALLHTELGPNHVLVTGDRVTGLIDFGEAMVGDPEYDLSAVGLFVTRGDRAAFGAFCRAYGYDAALADPDRPARLLRHALLHRYGTLAWYLRTLNPPTTELDALAEFWFAVA
jgi:hygromycin-B 7''-O-kinase